MTKLNELQKDKIVFDTGGKLMYWLIYVASRVHLGDRALIVNKHEADGYYEIVLDYDSLTKYDYIHISRPGYSTDTGMYPYKIIKDATDIRFDLGDPLYIGIPLVDAFLEAEKRGEELGRSLTSYTSQIVELIQDKKWSHNCPELGKDLKELKLKLVFSECFDSCYYSVKQLYNGKLEGSVHIKVYYPIGKKENGELIYSNAIPEEFASICINGNTISVTE